MKRYNYLLVYKYYFHTNLSLQNWQLNSCLTIHNTIFQDRDNVSQRLTFLWCCHGNCYIIVHYTRVVNSCYYLSNHCACKITKKLHLNIKLLYLPYSYLSNNQGGRRGGDRMVARFTTTYAISAYHHWCCEFESWSGHKVCQWLSSCFLHQ